MPLILSEELAADYPEVCFADRNAALPTTPSWDPIVWDPTSVTVQFETDEIESILVDVYLEDESSPDGLNELFDGQITLMTDGLLVFVPTGDEFVLEQVTEGTHRIRLFRDPAESRRVVALID